MLAHRGKLCDVMSGGNHGTPCRAHASRFVIVVSRRTDGSTVATSGSLTSQLALWLREIVPANVTLADLTRLQVDEQHQVSAEQLSKELLTRSGAPGCVITEHQCALALTIALLCDSADQLTILKPVVLKSAADWNLLEVKLSPERGTRYQCLDVLEATWDALQPDTQKSVCEIIAAQALPRAPRTSKCLQQTMPQYAESNTCMRASTPSHRVAIHPAVRTPHHICMAASQRRRCSGRHDRVYHACSGRHCRPCVGDVLGRGGRRANGDAALQCQPRVGVRGD